MPTQPYVAEPHQDEQLEVHEPGDRYSHSTWLEGALAGAVGATGVAVWFLIVDLVAGQAFHTPERLGAALFGALGFGVGPVGRVLGYTVFHYAAFALLGTVVTAMIHQARRTPTILIAVLLVFAAAEVGFYGLIALLDATELLGSLTWLLIAVGNLIGSVGIAYVLWRRHPGVGRAFDDALGGRV
jgi:hypothetical protein